MYIFIGIHQNLHFGYHLASSHEEEKWLPTGRKTVDIGSPLWYNSLMNKVDYRWIGVGALGVFAAISLAVSSSLLRMLSPSYSSVIILLGAVVTIILAEIWGVMYWRASRSILSTTTLAMI